jgi:glyceraldehyde 3-phosphate dehydrogenase
MAAGRVGIFGFGRTGRNAFRLLAGRPDLELAAICDTAPAEPLVYLLKFDTLQGRFAEPVELGGGRLRFRGREIPFWGSSPRGEVPDWRGSGVDVVLECTMRHLQREDYAKHLEAGAERVVVCAPSTGKLDLLLVPGIGEERLNRQHRVVGLASPTVACAAPVLAILLEAFGIERAFFNAVHAYTTAHRLADVPLEDKRRGRSAAENIIPQESRSEAVLGEILPPLRGKLVGSAVNVPVANGSAVDLTCWHERAVTAESVRDAVQRAARGAWRTVVAFEEEPIVSSDVTVSDFPCTFDSQAAMAVGSRISKTLSWFDSGWALARRAVDAAARLAAFGGEAAP